MATGKQPGDTDLVALIEQIYGGSPEDLRDQRMASALNTLEATHRQAARALRDVHTEGLRRKQMPALLPEAASPLPPQDSPGERRALSQTSGEPQIPAVQPNVPEVQSGEGREVELDHRTLTHIVRPNRGRR